MKFPPKPENQYILDNIQNKRIFKKLMGFSKRKLDKNQEKPIKLLFSQLENNW